MTNPSIIKLILLVHVILEGITEENNLCRGFWKRTFIILSFILLVKVLLKSIFPMDSKEYTNNTYSIFESVSTVNRAVEFFCGHVKFEILEIISLLCVIMNILQSQLSGYFDKYMVESENISTAFVRLKINKKFNDLWKKWIEKSEKFDINLQKTYDERVRYVKKFDFNIKSKFNEDESMILMVTKENSKKRDKELYDKILVDIEDKMIQTYYDFPIEAIQDSNWRRFSKYNRKPGMNFYLMATIVQIFTIVIIFLFYNQMEEVQLDSGTDALKSINVDKFSDKMILVLFFQIGVIVFERYLFLENPTFWMNWEMFKTVNKDNEMDPTLLLFSNINKDLEDLRATDKLKKICRRITFLIKLYGIDHKEFLERVKKAKKMTDQIEKGMKSGLEKRRQDYMYNPLFKKLKFLKFLMLCMYTIIFLILPAIGNKASTRKIFCNSFYKPEENLKCNHVNENIYIQIFFVLYTIYFVLSALQIKNGESFLKNQKKKDRGWSQGEKITNTIVTKVPFIFEIKTCLDFAVTKTGLSLFQWFKFEDIYNSFFAAKYDQIASDMKRLGVQKSKFEKLIFGWIALLIFLIIVLAPIFIFSNFNPDSAANTITSLQTSVGIKINYSKFELYSNYNPKSIKKMSEEDFSVQVGDYTKKVSTVNNEVNEVNLYPYGDSNWEITSDMYIQLTELLLNSLSSQDKTVQLYYSMKMVQKNGKTSMFDYSTAASSQIVLDLHDLLTKCSTTSKIQIPGFYYQVSLKVTKADKNESEQ